MKPREETSPAGPALPDRPARGLVDLDALMTPQEAAQLLGCGLATVYRAVDSQQIGTVTVGGRLMLMRPSVEAYQPKKAGRPGKLDKKDKKDKPETTE